MTRRLACAFTAAFALLLLISSAHAATSADRWPQWRGPRLDGVSEATNTPAEWSGAENVTWRLPMPGPAGSTPIVWEDRIFLTSVVGGDAGDELVLMCVSDKGEELWRRTVSAGNKNSRGDEGNSAAPSPSTDGEHVWAFVGTGVLACYTVDGEPVWKVNLQDRYGKFNIAFGMTSTPVLHEGRLYLQLIHGEGNPETREAVVACLDAKTGEEIWKQGRPSDARAECEHSYASPTLYSENGREFLLTHGADYAVAYSLDDGEELWRCGELNPQGNYNPTLRFVASPVAADGMIVVPSAKNGPVFALKADAQGDVTQKSTAFYWRRPHGTPDVPSPLIHDGLVYLYRENGNLVCLDAQTGDKHYEARTTPGKHRASPVLADGKIYLASRSGVVTVVRPGKEFEVLAKNEMGETIASSPVPVDGRLYIRTFDALYAIDSQ